MRRKANPVHGETTLPERDELPESHSIEIKFDDGADAIQRYLSSTYLFGPPDRGLRESEAFRRRRAVSYHRFSNLAESPDSIDRQAERTDRYAVYNQLDLVKRYDEPRASGAYLDNREVLQRLIAEVDELNVGIVIIESTDRLGRGIAVLGKLWGELEDRGIEIHDASAGVRIDAVRYAIMSGMAEADRRRLIFNLDSGKLRVARAGKPIMGRCFGYRFGLDHGNRRVREINPEEAETIRYIFKLFLSGVGIPGILRLLNSEGENGRHGKRWHGSDIAGSRNRPNGILRRLRYTGVQTWRARSSPMLSTGRRATPRWNPVSEWVLSPPVPELQIVSPQTFMAAQRRLAQLDRATEQRRIAGRARDPHWGARSSRLLSGLVKCGQCGAPMHLRKYSTHGISLKCGHTDRGLRQCLPSSFSLNWIESGVRDLLKAELVTKANAKTFVEEYNRHAGRRSELDAREASGIRRRLHEIDKSIDATFEVAVIKGLADERVVAKRMALLSEERELRDRLEVSERQTAGAVKLASGSLTDLVAALDSLIGGSPIDTSIREGAELIASMRETVASVSVLPKAADLIEIAVDLRAASMVQPEPARESKIVLKGNFRRPRRNAHVIELQAYEYEKVFSLGRHRIGDNEWKKLQHLLPNVFHFKGTTKTITARSAVEAVIFHLQTGAATVRMPSGFGNPLYVARAMRTLSLKKWWHAFEPALRALDPALLSGAMKSGQFPVGLAAIPGNARLPFAERVKAGTFRLTDTEWRAVSPELPASTLAQAGLAHLRPRSLADAAVFLVIEDAYPFFLPRVLGPRADLEKGIALLIQTGIWDRMAVKLIEVSPEKWARVDASRIKRYYSIERTFRVRGVRLTPAQAAEKLERIETAIASGVPSREAADKHGMKYQTYIRWRTNPILRGFMKSKGGK